jgi:hypothetical protein
LEDSEDDFALAVFDDADDELLFEPANVLVDRPADENHAPALSHVPESLDDNDDVIAGKH